MTEQTTYIDVGQHKVLNLDVDGQGNFIALTDNNTVVTNDHNLKISIDIHFPIIRRLDNETFLIVDSRTDSKLNGWVYNFKGQLLKSFLAGDGIEDIVVHRDKITITYFDEGILGNDGPNKDGLAVFNFSGEQIFGFNSSKIWGSILDCYCICKHGPNKVLFYVYTELKILELNLDTFKVERFETPNDLSGSSSISSKQNKIIFHSSYHDKRSFFSWDRNKNEVTKLSYYNANLRGIGNGKFITHDDKGFTIIAPT